MEPQGTKPLWDGPEILTRNLLGFTLLIGLAVDALMADWTYSPSDFLFARITGPLFTNAHATSVLALCVAAGWLSILNFRSWEPTKWVMLVFASASIHEFALFGWNFFRFGVMAFVPQWKDEVWYLAFLLVGLYVATPKQRRFLAVVTLYMAVLMGFYVNFFHDSDLETFASPTFIMDSAIEVFGWVSIAVMWLVAFGRHKA